MPSFSSRRRFMLGSSGLVMAGVAGLYFLSNDKRSSSREPALATKFASVIDTIVPEDDFPGAVTLGIDSLLINEAEQQPEFLAVWQRLILNIDRYALTNHQRAFSHLSIDDREATLLFLLSQDAPHQTRKDLRSLRTKTLTHYYRSEAGHKTLGFLHPTRYAAYR